MQEEAAPFLDALQGGREVALLGDSYSGPSRFVEGCFEGASVLVVTSGIGTTNASVAATAVIESFGPDAVVVAGTTGGLAQQIGAGDLVVADRALYHEANAVDFGYEAGQVPRMPVLYDADPSLVELAARAAGQEERIVVRGSGETSAREAGRHPSALGSGVWAGLVGSSNSFVTAPLAAGVRETFPDLLAVDMETAAVAQICWMFGVPWVSLRAVSDLCAPDGASEFRAHAPEAYLTSFEAVRTLVRAFAATVPAGGSGEEGGFALGASGSGTAPAPQAVRTGELGQLAVHPSGTPSDDASGSAVRKPVRRALLSVWDKTGLADLARGLDAAGVALVATSSTAAAIADAGVPVAEVSEVTGFPEILGGRVKTLHPRIHGGILARQDDEESLAALEELAIEPFDLVVANLYPFEQAVASGASAEECVEMIDIGGPTMVRAAAKNFQSVAIATEPDQYEGVLSALALGGTTEEERRAMAAAAFQLAADYDIAIANWFAQGAGRPDKRGGAQACGADSAGVVDSEAGANDESTLLPDWWGASFKKQADLRYGENPHQKAALYAQQAGGPEGIAGARQLGGKELSFNNLQDAAAALRAACAFEQPAVAIIKHANPCGIAVGASVEQAYEGALACDPLSAFGGVVAANRPVDEATAARIAKVFTEVVVAPGFSEGALEILSTKKNLRILVAADGGLDDLERRFVGGGLLVQEVDRAAEADRIGEWNLVAGAPATPEQARGLEVAWTAAQFTKSNAIVLVRDGATVGVGMGQVNRLDSARLAVERANSLGDGGPRARGAVAASDAFFPFPDGLDVLIQAGVTAVVAPGGSMRDQLVIDAAKAAGITLYFTTRRHFWH